MAYERQVAADEIDLDLGFLMMPEAIPKAKPLEPSGPIPPFSPDPPGTAPLPGPIPGLSQNQVCRNRFPFPLQPTGTSFIMPGPLSLIWQIWPERLRFQFRPPEEGFDKNKLRNGVVEPLQEADLIGSS